MRNVLYLVTLLTRAFVQSPPKILEQNKNIFLQCRNIMLI